MPKSVLYACDGEKCGAHREMAIGEYPQGWKTITLVLRMFRGRQPERRRGSEDADATTYVHLCSTCKRPANPALVFEKLVDEGYRVPGAAHQGR